MEILKLLESKNRCLEKFLNDSENFLASTEKGDVSVLQELHNRRETIIKAIQLYDRKITELIQEMPPGEKTTLLIDSVRKVSLAHDHIIQAIIVADQKIALKIEEEKKRLLEELSASDRKKQLTSKFKSKWITESGDQLDGTL